MNTVAFTVAKQVRTPRPAARALNVDLSYAPLPGGPKWGVASVLGAGTEAGALVESWQTLRLAPEEPRAWADFLDNLEEGEVALTRSHAERVRSVWRDLRKALGPHLALPLAEPGEDGALKLSWSSKEVYADLELHPDGSQEWFWRDRRRDVYGGSTQPTHGSLDTRLLDAIARVAPAR